MRHILHSDDTLVSILMPAKDVEATVSEALDSLLMQTFSNFVVFVVNDGSTDKTPAILQQYADLDKRLYVLHNSESKGLAACLNQCLALVRTPYIARMDADDIALPERLAKQVAFMEAHSDISVCGSWIDCFGAVSGVIKNPIEHTEIIANMLFFNTISHPSVIMRSGVLRQASYDDSFLRAQDYELWSRLLYDHHLHAHNLPEVLLRYRTRHSDVFRPWHIEVLRRNIKRLGIEPTERELALHTVFSLGLKTGCALEFSLQDAVSWLNKLFEANEEHQLITSDSFSRILQQHFICCASFFHARQVVRSISAIRFAPLNRLTFCLRGMKAILFC